jgi:ABC-type uncharacterized transport system fused permease/ATPase subunit
MEDVIPTEEIIAVLNRLELQEVLEHANGLDQDQDWDDLLSIGEQHLLSIARIFLAKPVFVFLDRPGSSLPKSKISTILDMLTDQGIGVVVLSKNGESRLKYDAILEILENGAWEKSNGLLAAKKPELMDLSC